jgi:hypothetical protein
MEAQAIRAGAFLALERFYSHISIMSDTKEVVSLCNGDKHKRSGLMAICQEIGEIRRAFSSFSISYIGCDANNAAHLCAKKASDKRRRCMWINYNPGFFASTLSE